MAKDRTEEGAFLIEVENLLAESLGVGEGGISRAGVSVVRAVFAWWGNDFFFS